MEDFELRKRLDEIKRIAMDARSEAKNKGHFLIIFLLIAIASKACNG